MCEYIRNTIEILYILHCTEPSSTAFVLRPRNHMLTFTYYRCLLLLPGVVDRSVEILSRGKTGSLSTAAVFQLLQATEPYIWLNSQINDYAYCSGDSPASYYDDGTFAFSDVVGCLLRKVAWVLSIGCNVIHSFSSYRGIAHGQA